MLAEHPHLEQIARRYDYADLRPAHFGSVRRAMSASREELLTIKGLGRKKVEALLQVLDGPDG